MAVQVQLTTYLSTDEQIQDWNTVKAHFDDMKDAAVLRELIRGKAIDIGRGSTKRQAIDEIRQDVKELRASDDAIRATLVEYGALLRLLCEKLSVEVTP
jgi:hypothetical protein